MILSIEPFGAPLGAEVLGFDFSSPIDVPSRDRLRGALDDYLLLVFRNSECIPSDHQVVDFCSAFGDLRPTLADRSRLPEHPAVNLVSNRKVGGVHGTGGNGIVTWHSDLHFSPPLIELLFLDALKVTSTGGNTKWTNLCAAYDALDPELAEQIDGMAVRYGLRDDLDLSDYFKASDSREVTCTTEISLVQVNPRTGRKAVWPNIGPDFTAEVVGLSPSEGQELLAKRYRHCTRDRFVYVHDWHVGDACLWLNNQTMHQREGFPDDEERVMRHVNILGLTDRHQRQTAQA